MRHNLTQGPISKKLLLFAVPLLLSSLVQQLYNTMDLIFVGNFIGKSASSAIGVSSLLISCLVGFFGGMSVGSGVVASHIYGSGNKTKLMRVIQNAVALSLAGGLLLMVMGNLFAPHYLRLINTPQSLRADAVGYLRIYFLSLVPAMIYNIGAGVLRALGDSKTPLYAQIIGGTLNVLLDALFVGGLGQGVRAVAWTTVVAQIFAAVFVTYRLTKLEPTYALRLRKIGFDKELVKSVIAIGIPAGTQSLVITLSNVMVQYQINSLGEDSIAAFTAYFKVELLIYLPIVAFGQAIMTFVGQNLGAGEHERIYKGTRQCLFMGAILTAVLSALALLMGPVLFRAFAKDEAVIGLGVQIIRTTFPFYIIYVVLQVLGDSLRGLGKVRPPMLIVMLNICIVRTVLLFFIVPRFPSIQGVAVVYPITWALTAVCMAVYYLHHKKQLSRPQFETRKA